MDYYGTRYRAVLVVIIDGLVQFVIHFVVVIVVGGCYHCCHHHIVMVIVVVVYPLGNVNGQIMV